MLSTRTPSLFGLIPLLAIGCAPASVEQALPDDDVVDYVPSDRSVEIRTALDPPEVMEMPEDILEIAIAEEGKTLEQVGVSTGFPLSTYAGAAPGGWCSEFVAWSYWRGGCPFTDQRGTYPWMIGGSTQIRQWFTTNSRFVYQTSAEWASYEPQPGDYIRYNNPEGGHSGMVRYADGTTLYTVEGNVNSKVMLRTLRNYKTAYADPEDGIDGFGVMTEAQCGSTNGTGGAAGTSGSTGGGAGSTGAGGRGAAGGSSGGVGTGGRGGRGDAGATAGTGADAGRGGSSATTGSGGRTGRRGTGGTAGSSTGGATGRAGVGGSADTGGTAGGASARGGSLAGREASGGSAGVGGQSSSGGAPGLGGTFLGSSPQTGVGGNSPVSAPSSSSGCSCSIRRGSDASHGLWLIGLAALWALRRRVVGVR